MLAVQSAIFVLCKPRTGPARQRFPHLPSLIRAPEDALVAAFSPSPGLDPAFVSLPTHPHSHGRCQSVVEGPVEECNRELEEADLAPSPFPSGTTLPHQFTSHRVRFPPAVGSVVELCIPHTRDQALARSLRRPVRSRRRRPGCV